MIISFGGSEGSGKSGIAKRLAKDLGWPYYDIGGLRRQRATELNMTLEEYNRLGEHDPKTDTEVDEYQQKLGLREDNFVICGRTSWYFISHSLKIFLKVRLEVGAERIFNDLQHRNEADSLKTIKDVTESLQRRLKSDDYRYKKYFGIDCYDEKNFDWILDTSDMNQEEAYQQVYDYVKKTVKIT